MKTIKLLSMLFIASALCLGFACCGDDDDDNKLKEEIEQTDYSKLIPGHWQNIASTSSISETLSINYNGVGTICLYDLVDNDWGVTARGTYTLNGSNLTATYTNVSVIDSDYEPTTYHGFTDGKSKTVKYTIESCDGKKMVLKDESGKTLTYEKYADVK